jgi:Zn-dependent metalloprotease
MELIIDGRTGHVLKKWDGLVHAAARGTGHSQYNGDVALNTDDVGDGTFRLLDSVHPTRSWPMADSWAYYTDLQGVGMRVIEGFFIPALLSTTNEWGDGLPFSGLDNPRSRETAGVDALFGAGATWDYYANVLGRTGGIDGNGSSPFLSVHYGTSSSPPFWNNAAWDPAMFVMYFGDGAETGALTCLDVTAHELSHGVFGFTARLNYRGEPAGVNEANSDVHAVMMKFYQWGAGGAGSTVPDTVTSAPGGITDPLSLWSIGGQLATTGEPLRWLYKPSLDGISYDAWFDGIGLDDSHFSMGPGNRAFFFLAQGASSDPQSVTYSPYLPGGMTGLGNDAAVKLWFHAIATKVTDPTTDFHGLRAALIESAAELYGDAAVAAVQNAFAAVNVGAPAGGQETITVMLPVDPVVAAIFGDTHLVVVPRMVPTRLPTPLVNGAPDENVTWSLGGLSPVWPVGGKILDGNIFLAPEFIAVEGDWPVKVFSNADARRFAAAIVVSLSLDCDSDTDVDALDLGALAVTYGLGRPSGVYPGSNLTGSATGVDDVAVAAFLLGFNNAYKH